MQDEIRPARLLGRVGGQAREVRRREGAGEGVGSASPLHLGVTDVVHSHVGLRRRADPLPRIGCHVLLDAAVEHSPLVRAKKMAEALESRRDKLRHLRLHAL